MFRPFTALAGDVAALGWQSVVGDLLETKQLTAALDLPVPLSNGYFVNRPKSSGAENAKNIFTSWLKRQAGT